MSFEEDVINRQGRRNRSNRDLVDFNDWFMALLTMNTIHEEYGLHHPVGACCFRNVLRDKEVKYALESAWKRIIENGEQPK